MYARSITTPFVYIIIDYILKIIGLLLFYFACLSNYHFSIYWAIIMFLFKQIFVICYRELSMTYIIYYWSNVKITLYIIFFYFILLWLSYNGKKKNIWLKINNMRYQNIIIWPYLSAFFIFLVLSIVTKIE